jgi:porphobilinogen synthase
MTERLDLAARPRRNRKSEGVRRLVRETSLAPSNLIYPLFVHARPGDEPVASMPGCMRWSLDGLVAEAGHAVAAGVPAVAVFPAIDPSRKSPSCDEAWNEDGLVPAAVRALKSSHPALVVVTDVALDPYNSEGHDGLVGAGGRVLNDETVAALCRQALCQARAGADVVAPSDMMDGRVGAVRAALDAGGFQDVSVLSYAAKYASAFYGPFRGALGSAPRSGDKKSYQMDPANVREAVREAQLDEDEGADILMVKPAGLYLDVIAAVREATVLPVAAYQVSGEYLMVKSAAAAGWIDEKEAVLESLTAIRRAGADMVLTYFARQAAGWLAGDAG